MSNTQANGAKPGLAGRVASTAVANTEPPSLIQLVNKQGPEIERALPAHLKGNAESFARALVTVIKQTPKLAACDPYTVLGGLMQASSLGLEFGPLGHCYLVPFKNKSGAMEAQFIVGYKGKIDLAWRSGKLISIGARTVREGDEFDFDYGLVDALHHKPDLRNESGGAFAWYMTAKFVGGGHHFVVLGKSGVEEHRKHSKSKDSPYSPWKTNYNSMACKSTIHEAGPFIPMTRDDARNFNLDNVVIKGTSIHDLEYEEPDNDYGTVIDVDEVPDAEENGEVKTFDPTLPLDQQ